MCAHASMIRRSTGCHNTAILAGLFTSPPLQAQSMVQRLQPAFEARYTDLYWAGLELAAAAQLAAFTEHAVAQVRAACWDQTGCKLLGPNLVLSPAAAALLHNLLVLQLDMLCSRPPSRLPTAAEPCPIMMHRPCRRAPCWTGWLRLRLWRWDLRMGCPPMTRWPRR